jgi:DNA-binding transcriptional LysR family regulator
MALGDKQRATVDSQTKRIGVDWAKNLPAIRSVDGKFTRRLGMTLNQFAFFAAVAKYSNLTKASAELRVSQSSISQQLRQLEQSYGAKLYRRLSKGIEITEAGQLFLRNIIPILELVAKLGDSSKVSEETDAKVLSIGGTFSASAVLLPALLARFQARHPTVELEFRTASAEQLEDLVTRSTMDLAVTDRKPTLEALACDPLRRETALVFVLPSHPLARRKIVNLSDVLAEPLIVRGGRGISGTTESALNRFREQGWTVKIGVRCDTPDGIKAAVRQEMGIGIAFADSIRAEIGSGEFKVLKVRGLNVHAESFIIYSKKRPLSPLAREFFELLCGVRATHTLYNRSSGSTRSTVSLRSDRVGQNHGTRTRRKLWIDR